MAHEKGKGKARAMRIESGKCSTLVENVSAFAIVRIPFEPLNCVKQTHNDRDIPGSTPSQIAQHFASHGEADRPSRSCVACTLSRTCTNLLDETLTGQAKFTARRFCG